MNKQLFLFMYLSFFYGIMHANFFSKLLGLNKSRKRTPSVIIEETVVTVSNYCSNEDFRVYFEKEKNDFILVKRSGSSRIPIGASTNLWISENRELAIRFLVNDCDFQTKIYINRRTNGSLSIGKR